MRSREGRLDHFGQLGVDGQRRERLATGAATQAPRFALAVSLDAVTVLLVGRRGVVPGADDGRRPRRQMARHDGHRVRPSRTALPVELALVPLIPTSSQVSALRSGPYLATSPPPGGEEAKNSI